MKRDCKIVYTSGFCRCNWDYSLNGLLCRIPRWRDYWNWNINNWFYSIYFYNVYDCYFNQYKFIIEFDWYGTCFKLTFLVFGSFCLGHCQANSIKNAIPNDSESFVLYCFKSYTIQSGTQLFSIYSIRNRIALEHADSKK